jgi:hypothetical protein
MENIKKVIKSLQAFNNSNEITLIKSGSQRINEWDQETAIEQSHFLHSTQNYVLNMQGHNYLFNVKEELEERVTTAHEGDDIVVENEKDKHKTIFSIAPLYFEERFEYDDFTEQYGEVYEINHLTNEDNVPAMIKNFAASVKEAEKLTGHAPIDNEFDLALYNDQKEKMKRLPDAFNPFSLKPIVVNSDVVFDMQLKAFKLEDEFDFYDAEKIGITHKANFPKSDLLDSFEKDGVKIDDLIALNKIANSTNNPKSFLNKLDKYSNVEALEMFHMMKSSPKVVEIFTKGLTAPTPNIDLNQEQTNKRSRGNRPR